MAAFLLWFAYYSDKRVVTEDSEQLISLNLELCVTCIVAALMLASTFRAPHSLSLFLARCMFVLLGFFCFDFSLYMAFYPIRKTRTLSIVRMVMLVFLVFYVFNFFIDINVSIYFGLDVFSRSLLR